VARDWRTGLRAPAAAAYRRRAGGYCGLQEGGGVAHRVSSAQAGSTSSHAGWQRIERRRRLRAT